MSLFPMYSPIFFFVFRTLAPKERLNRDLGLELFLNSAKLGKNYLEIMVGRVSPN